MEALVKYANTPGAVELRAMPQPVITPDQVLLRVRAVGICGSDLEMYHHKITFPVQPPVILGHEFSGTVVEVGSNVRDFRPGDRVVSETAAYICGKCAECRTGNYNECPDRLGFGILINGADAPFVAVRAGALHRVPANVDLTQAALTEPLCVAYNALVVKSRIRPADVVVVLGPGPIGLMAVQIARLAGASTIILAGRNRELQRMQIGRVVGATHLVDRRQDALGEVVRALMRRRGADLVVDAAGPLPRSSWRSTLCGATGRSPKSPGGRRR